MRPARCRGKPPLPETAQSHTPLTADDLADLDRARDWVKGHFTDAADTKYEPLDGKLRVISAVIDNKWVEASETWKLQSLGVAFGDAIAQSLLMDWVVIDDEYGRSPVLNWPGTSLLCSPMTMIAKRIEDGETVDVRLLFEQTCERLKTLAFSGDFI